MTFPPADDLFRPRAKPDDTLLRWWRSGTAIGLALPAGVGGVTLHYSNGRLVSVEARV